MFLARPGSQQPWPKSAACWSPAMPAIGISAPNHSGSVTPNTPLEARNIHRYLESVRWQLAAIARAHGYEDIQQLSRDDLAALTPEAAAITGLPYMPELRARDGQALKVA